jgi:hypothetical protein
LRRRIPGRLWLLFVFVMMAFILRKIPRSSSGSKEWHLRLMYRVLTLLAGLSTILARRGSPRCNGMVARLIRFMEDWFESFPYSVSTVCAQFWAQRGHPDQPDQFAADGSAHMQHRMSPRRCRLSWFTFLQAALGRYFGCQLILRLMGSPNSRRKRNFFRNGSVPEPLGAMA